MTLPRKANHDSHLRIFPAHGRVLVSCTRRLSGHSVSTTRHNANGIVAHQGPQMGHMQGAANVDHRALLSRDETPWHDVQGTTRRCEAESIVFHGGVASWRGIQGGASRQCPVPGAGTTGPKMDPNIIALWIEKSCSATLRGSRCHAAPNNSSSSVPVAHGAPPSAGSPDRAGRPVTRSAPWSRTSWCGSDKSPRCAGGLRARSTVLLRGRVHSWWANQQRDGGGGQSVLEKKTSLSLCSAAALLSPRAASSLVTGSQPASVSRAASAPSATRTSSLQASRSRTPAQCTRSTGRCWRNDSQTKEPEAERRSLNSVSGGAFAGSLPSGEIEPSVTLACPPSESSSGDGLGIHQPGSMTRGFAIVLQSPSGRARDRAICPAVARFIDRRPS